MNGRIAENVVIKVFVMNGVIKMKMSIAEAIETLLYTRSYGSADIAKSVAIKTMRKYKKIEKIGGRNDEISR